MPDATATPYLEGIRVLDFTQYLAGPSCTRLLAEMGADVIKVEIAPNGDPIRVNSPRRDHRSGYFVQQNRGKRSVCVDLRRPEAVQALLDLVPQRRRGGGELQCRRAWAGAGSATTCCRALNPRLDDGVGLRLRRRRAPSPTRRASTSSPRPCRG